MMTILHIAPNLRPGGTAAMAAELACELQQRGDCTNIVVSPACELVSRLRTAGVEHRLCRKVTPLNFISEFRKLRELINRAQPHIIQVYSPEAALLTSVACRRLLTKHRPMLVAAITAYPRPGIARYFWLKCDAYVTASQHLRQVLSNGLLKLRRKDLRRIPYGVNDKQCYPAFRISAERFNQWKNAHPESNSRLTLCLPGAISPLHGLEDLIPILTSLLHWGIPVHAYIAGDSRKADSSYTEELKRKFAAANLSEHISWIGARPDLRDVMCACDITLTLTREPATYNRPVLEALALGRPVVGYDHGVVGELLEAFLPEGRVAPGDAAAVADTISQWHTYRPATITELPLPYRLSSTAESLFSLYQQLSSPCKS